MSSSEFAHQSVLGPVNRSTPENAADNEWDCECTERETLPWANTGKSERGGSEASLVSLIG